MPRSSAPPTSPAALTRICLVRHGETDWNAQRRLQGHQDIPLNANGLAQARSLAAALSGTPFAAIYSSDLTRAMDTAAGVAAALGLQVTQLPAARERNFGIFQGLTRDEAQERFPALQAKVARREPDFVPPEGESLRQCFERIAAVLDSLADAHAGEAILLVAHGGVLDAARRFVTGMPLHLPRDFELGNAALNWLRRDQAGWQVESWNDQQHLSISRDELQI